MEAHVASQPEYRAPATLTSWRSPRDGHPLTESICLLVYVGARPSKTKTTKGCRAETQFQCEGGFSRALAGGVLY